MFKINFVQLQTIAGKLICEFIFSVCRLAVAMLADSFQLITVKF